MSELSVAIRMGCTSPAPPNEMTIEGLGAAPIIRASMSTLTIKPEAVLLTSGQSATFQAFEGENGIPVEVTWSLSPGAVGGLEPDDGKPRSSAVYVAPVVTSAQTVAIVARQGEADSATATINLTPNAITILPSLAELSTRQRQEFRAIVAGSPAPALTWLLSPPIGKLEPGDVSSCVYQAPLEIDDSIAVSVIASSATSALPASATLKLSSPPWTGPGVQLLGAFLLLVFWLVLPLIGLWPPALPSPDAARLARIEAAQELADQTSALQVAELGVADAQERLDNAQKEPPPAPQPTKTAATDKAAKTAAAPPGSPQPAQPAPSAAAPPPAPPQAAAEEPKKSVAAIKLRIAEDALERVTVARQAALGEVAAKQAIEHQANDANVRTWLFGTINRELDLLFLVLLAGGLGAFLHVAQSFSRFVGDRELKAQWVWWYACRPFIGAALALVFYGSVRGGFMALSTGASGKAADLNAFGLVSVAALVGMFSRAATVKLGEVFDTLFQSTTPKSKDALGSNETPKPPTPPAAVLATPKLAQS